MAAVASSTTVSDVAVVDQMRVQLRLLLHLHLLLLPLLQEAIWPRLRRARTLLVARAHSLGLIRVGWGSEALESMSLASLVVCLVAS